MAREYIDRVAIEFEDVTLRYAESVGRAVVRIDPRELG